MNAAVDFWVYSHSYDDLFTTNVTILMENSWGDGVFIMALNMHLLALLLSAFPSLEAMLFYSASCFQLHTLLS